MWTWKIAKARIKEPHNTNRFFHWKVVTRVFLCMTSCISEHLQKFQQETFFSPNTEITSVYVTCRVLSIFTRFSRHENLFMFDAAAVKQWLRLKAAQFFSKVRQKWADWTQWNFLKYTKQITFFLLWLFIVFFLPEFESCSLHSFIWRVMTDDKASLSCSVSSEVFCVCLDTSLSLDVWPKHSSAAARKDLCIFNRTIYRGNKLSFLVLCLFVSGTSRVVSL